MTDTTTVDLRLVKARQQQTWASGDFSVVASRIVLVSERLAEAADIAAGSNVIDVACGSGNATIAAARSGAHAVGVDYVPELLEQGRLRAAAEGLDVEFVEGDAEDLPFDDDVFDTTLSVYGSMFAPDHRQAARELVRVTRPGGTVALASWTPDGYLGDVFRTMSAHVPGPAGVPSPMLWGDESHLRELFGDDAAELRSTVEVCTFRFRSAEELVAWFRKWYGPTLKAFGTLDEPGQEALAADLAEVARRYARDVAGTIAVPGTYLQSVIRLR